VLGWVTEQRQQWSTATWAPKSSRTFDEVADHWLTLREADTSIGPNTVRADRESLAYARRAFGAVPVQKLTPAALANWSATLTGKGGRTLAPATKRRAIVRLKSVMAHARKMRWLTYDPSADLESPDRRRSPPPQPMTFGRPSRWGSFSITSRRIASAGVSR
jgi:site-specific recombinase XerD